MNEACVYCMGAGTGWALPILDFLSKTVLKKYFPLHGDLFASSIHEVARYSLEKNSEVLFKDVFDTRADLLSVPCLIVSIESERTFSVTVMNNVAIDAQLDSLN